MVRSLCDFSRAVVPHMRCQRGDKHQRAIKQFGQALRPRLDSRCTMTLEARTTVGQQAQALQKGVGDHRLVDIELEVAAGAGEVDRGVVAQHPRADHRQRLGLGRIDLARHDRAAWLVLRYADFADPAARTARQPADIVGDLVQRRGKGLQRTMGRHERLVTGQCRKFVRGTLKGQAEFAGETCRDCLAETFGRVQSGSHRRAADGKGVKPWQSRLQMLTAVVELGHIARELLPQAQWRCVLQVRPANLEQVAKRPRFSIQRGSQTI